MSDLLGPKSNGLVAVRSVAFCDMLCMPDISAIYTERVWKNDLVWQVLLRIGSTFLRARQVVEVLNRITDR